MYEKIKQLADEAVALQNKNRMDAALREISALTVLQMETEALADAVGGEVVTYGTAKSYDSEAEMIADIQGSPSPVFPLPAKKKGAKK